jgi:hypothetical protein
MKKAMPKEDRSLFAMPQEMRPAIGAQREPATAKRIAVEAGVLGKVKKTKTPAKPKRSRKLNGLR